MKKLLVIGSAVADVIIRIDCLPKTGEDVHIKKQSLAIGGCAYLAGNILRHFGIPILQCSAIGGGMYGDYIYRSFLEKNIPVLVHLPEEKNGCCYCIVEADGERTFIVDHGIEYSFHESYLTGIDPEEIDSVYVCGLELEESCGEEIIHYLEKHREYSIYFAPGPRIMKLQQDRIEKILDLHPILHLNAEESMTYTHTGSVELAARVLYERTEAPVIITMGAEGSLCFDGTMYKASPVPASVVDTIGAGDSHIGAVMACRKLGYSYPESIEIANCISSAVVSQSGGELTEEGYQAIFKENRTRTLKTDRETETFEV